MYINIRVHILCMCVVNKQCELLEFVFDFVYVDLSRLLDIQRPLIFSAFSILLYV